MQRQLRGSMLQGGGSGGGRLPPAGLHTTCSFSVVGASYPHGCKRPASSGQLHHMQTWMVGDALVTRWVALLAYPQSTIEALLWRRRMCPSDSQPRSRCLGRMPGTSKTKDKREKNNFHLLRGAFPLRMHCLVNLPQPHRRSKAVETPHQHQALVKGAPSDHAATTHHSRASYTRRASSAAATDEPSEASQVPT